MYMQKDMHYEGFVLVIQTSDASYVMKMRAIPNKWFFATFTFMPPTELGGNQ